MKISSTSSLTLIALFIILVVPLLALGQSIESGWQGIKPLQTTKVDVEKMLGTPEVDDNGYHRYRTDSEFVSVNYATEPCTENRYGRGKYNVPSGTVLSYYVVLKGLVKLADFPFKKEKYYRDNSGDLLNSVTYRNPKDGVAIGVSILDAVGTEYVGQIDFSPPENLTERIICHSNDGIK